VFDFTARRLRRAGLLLMAALLVACASAPPPTCEARLQSLRGEINRIDGELARLAGERLAVAKQIGAVKQTMGKPVVDLAREASVVEGFVNSAKQHGVPESTSTAIIQSLIAAARARQTNGGLSSK
jgi:chorismate mutase